MASARRVWDHSPALQASKPVLPETASPKSHGGIVSWTSRVRQFFRDFEMYFSTKVWIPSMALSMLHFNLITWRANFITYLINLGYSLTIITVARAIGSLLEISSTIAMPRGVQHLGKAQHVHVPGIGDVDDDDSDTKAGLNEGNINQDSQNLCGLQRFGLWGFTWQLVNTAPVVVTLWAISVLREEEESILAFARRVVQGKREGETTPSIKLNIAWSVLLFTFLALSRFGVWVYDLTTQQLTQTLVPEHQRSTFAGVETSVTNIFEVLGAGAAIAFPRTEQFKGLSLASFVVVFIGWFMYAVWVRGQRGHLVHWENLAWTNRRRQGR